MRSISKAFGHLPEFDTDWVRSVSHHVFLKFSLAQLSLAYQFLYSERDNQHQPYQYRAIGQSHTVLAIADPANDVGRRQFMLGGHQKDHC